MNQFDFIIVGAGSAGCVLADRLTACGRYKVLLLEAGGSDNRFWIKVPLGYGKTYDDPLVNWCYTAQSDPGLAGRAAFWPRGRVLGGSSSINAMAYVQGLPQDFDDWETAGAAGWNWSSVRETYAQLETRDRPGPDGRRRLSGSGPVHVSDVGNRMHPFSDHFLKAAAQAGWPIRDDLNGAARDGIARLHGTVRNGRRWSAADAFLRPALKRPNLHLVSEALVERVLLHDGRATGVAYRARGHRVQATATREVIVSAGAVNSPQLLQLSGIGPAELLKRHGITVARDLPQVGQGLQDHLGISYQFTATEPTLNNRLGNWPGKMAAGLRYLLTRGGPLSVPINQISGFVPSTPGGSADMQVYCNPMSYSVRPDGKPDVAPMAGFLICAQPCRPTSRGAVTIRSPDPGVAPDIRPNSLSTNEDCAMAVAAGRIAQKLAETPAIRAVTVDGPDISAMSDADLLADFRQRAGSVYHASCTCRMGSSARDSVLDSRLRVHGVAGLRVIDASSFPNVTSGNTNAPVMMLAARGAEMILRDS
ncbi:GMC family oxidoreductase N-terminal domain-containing protein [Ruegeria pomeroyi]|uniref:GMC family oxidoreductase n=1 Tax=Ruegeria pomeroyi TaxID=89184 RepID=UPI001F2EF473|nr:GMC family oxidoreductase N-terminal domain-containing protein [Ruegeria pomeroyi]MCE8509696.1 GMC family oxidoreductase N-terminal domain-containing protein [Ruegeria pomeroyi]